MKIAWQVVFRNSKEKQLEWLEMTWSKLFTRHEPFAADAFDDFVNEMVYSYYYYLGIVGGAADDNLSL